jgi:cytochrome c
MKSQPRMLLAALILAAASVPAAAQSGGDAANGEKVFKKCMACHRIGDGAKNLVGPVLTGVIGRKAGTFEGFHYSELNKHAGENGLVWTPEHIINYLPDPTAFLKKYLTDAGKADLATGTSRMTFKLQSEQERKDVVAYLEKFSSK